MPEQDTEGCLEQFEVGKRVCLYLARVAPQQAIDHLAYELAQLAQQEDDPPPPSAPKPGPPKVPLHIAKGHGGLSPAARAIPAGHACVSTAIS